MVTRKTLTLVVLVQFSLAFELASAAPVPRQKETATNKLVEPKLVDRVEADYPAEVRADGIGGIVVVEIVVDTSGVVTVTRALTGHNRLIDAALGAAKQWTFEPATSEGKAIRMLGAITFCFAMNRSETTSRFTFSFEKCCTQKVKKTADPCARVKK